MTKWQRQQKQQCLMFWPQPDCKTCWDKKVIRTKPGTGLADVPCPACAPPATPIGAGMEPGQRCTSCGGIARASDCPACEVAAGSFVEGKCHACGYVEPAPFQPPPTGKVCETWCGTESPNRLVHGHNKCWMECFESKWHCFCSPGCRKAGKPTHPTSREEPKR